MSRRIECSRIVVITSRSCVALVSSALAGCISYGPADASRMSTYEICALQANQGPNLTGESRMLLNAEVAKRKEDCARHLRRIQVERDEALYDLTYRNQSP